VRPTPRQEDDRLEEARLAGGVRTPDELRTPSELGVERVVTAEVENAQRTKQESPRLATFLAVVLRGRRLSSATPSARGCSAYDVVRTGMTT
jgi:hypothetical protein